MSIKTKTNKVESITLKTGITVVELEELGLIEVDEDTTHARGNYIWYISKIKLLEEKIKILEELTGFNTDDYEFETEIISKICLVKKIKEEK